MTPESSKRSEVLEQALMKFVVHEGITIGDLLRAAEEAQKNPDFQAGPMAKLLIQFRLLVMHALGGQIPLREVMEQADLSGGSKAEQGLKRATDRSLNSSDFQLREAIAAENGTFYDVSVLKIHANFVLMESAALFAPLKAPPSLPKLQPGDHPTLRGPFQTLHLPPEQLQPSVPKDPPPAPTTPEVPPKWWQRLIPRKWWGTGKE